MRNLILFAFLFLCFQLKNNCQTFNLVKQAGGLGYDQGCKVLSDSQGNIYASGFIDSDAWFDDNMVTSQGCFDHYLAKYSSAGVILWTLSFGGLSCDYSQALTIDNNSNVYVGGDFQQSVTFPDTTVLGAGSNNAIITKFSPDGQLIWVKSFSGNGSSRCRSATFSENGFLYVTGTFNDTLMLDTFQLVTTGSYDVYFAKMDTMGNVIWANQLGGTGQDDVTDLETDIYDNIFILGKFYGVSNFGSSQLTSTGTQDIFVAKYNFSGVEQWAKKIGSNNSDWSANIGLDDLGNIYITGGLKGITTIDDTTVSPWDFFLIKMDASSNLTWLRQARSTHDCKSFGMDVDGTGNIFISGQFQDTMYIQNDTLAGPGVMTYRGFFANYSEHGYLRNIFQTTNTGMCIPADLSLANDSSVLITGVYDGTVDIGGYTLTPSGGNDIFIARISKEQLIGIDNESDFLDASLYPNPCQYGFTLDIGDNFSKPLIMSIYDTFGRLVKTENIQSQKNLVDVENLSSGMYFVVINHSNKKLLKKFIKQ